MQPQNLCCSLRQLKDLQTNFGTPQQLMMPGCPTCYYNFRKNFCDMTCHPRQSDYVRADHLVTGPGFDLGDGNYTGQEVEMVKNLTYFVAEEFASRTFDSCKNVQFPEVGDTIMFMLCGSWGSQECTPRRWWDFLGSVDNGYSPFAISYDYGVKTNTSEDGHYYHNPDVLSCDEIAPGYNYSCSCPNCPESCTTSACPDSWFPLGKYCYHISQHQLDWGSSEEVPSIKFTRNFNIFFSQYCWNAGGYLAEFNAQDEEQALDSVLNLESIYWIGLSDFLHEGTWKWQESGKEPSYTNWAEGQPSNGRVGGIEDCAAKSCNNPNRDCKWNDQPCNDNNYAHALCQIEK